MFNYRANSQKEEAKVLFLYCLFGGAVAVLFIVIEYSVYRFFGETDTGRQLGALVALVVCAAVKYRLDKSYVFK